MTRIFVDQPLATGVLLELPEGAARHLVQVLKFEPDDAFVLFNGTGGEYAARIESVKKRSVSARIGTRHNVERESHLALTLAQCVSKGERMDYTIQKAVELGVTTIVPLLSARTVVRLDAERWEKKLEHWRGIVIAACEQSGRTRIPTLWPVATFKFWLDQAPAQAQALKLTLSPQGSSILRDLPPGANPAVVLLVGPEGGLSDAELAAAQRATFRPLRLGPRTLRTETAGVAALAVVQALWGDCR